MSNLVVTAKYLINSINPSDGYTQLYERDRRDLTVEAIVVENTKWHPLSRMRNLPQQPIDSQTPSGKKAGAPSVSQFKIKY
jgi:hypothetical protein